MQFSVFQAPVGTSQFIYIAKSTTASGTTMVLMINQASYFTSSDGINWSAPQPLPSFLTNQSWSMVVGRDGAASNEFAFIYSTGNLAGNIPFAIFDGTSWGAQKLLLVPPIINQPQGDWRELGGIVFNATGLHVSGINSKAAALTRWNNALTPNAAGNYPFTQTATTISACFSMFYSPAVNKYFMTCDINKCLHDTTASVSSTWANVNAIPGSSAAKWMDMAYGNGVHVMVGSLSSSFYTSQPANSNFLVTSVNGLSWTKRTLPTSRIWIKVVFNPTTGRFYILSDNGPAGAPVPQVMYSSADGITWTAEAIPVTATLAVWSEMFMVNGKLVLFGSTSTTSTNVFNIAYSI